MLKEAKKWTQFKQYKEEQGAKFYPEEYVGKDVIISEKGIEIYQDEKLLERYDIDSYCSNIVDKYDYQNENKIHDELGIENEKIQVFTGRNQAEEGTLLDGDVVVISEDEVIIKIYQGWFLLEREW